MVLTNFESVAESVNTGPTPEETLVHVGTAGRMAPAAEWNRQPVLGSLLDPNSPTATDSVKLVLHACSSYRVGFFSRAAGKSMVSSIILSP